MANSGKRQSILLVDNEEHLGGGQIVGLNLIKILFEKKFMVGVLAPQRAKVVSQSKRYVKKANIHVVDRLEFASGNKSFKDGFAVFQHGVKNFLKMSFTFFRYDLIYVNSIKLLPISIVILFLLRKNFIVHVHLLYGNTILRLIALVCSSTRCKAVVCCSELVHGRLKTVLKNKKLITIRNSLSRDLADIDFDNRFDGHLKVGFIGDISISKGADIVFKLATEFPFLEFFLIGRETLDFEAKRDNVTIVHNREDVWSFVREKKINVVIVPSRVPESFGLVAIESCAMSCITIVSSAGYLNSIGDLCGLHICSDEEMYSAILTDLCKMDSLGLEEMARQSWNRAKMNYSFDNFEQTISESLIPLITNDPMNFN